MSDPRSGGVEKDDSSVFTEGKNRSPARRQKSTIVAVAEGILCPISGIEVVCRPRCWGGPNKPYTACPQGQQAKPCQGEPRFDRAPVEVPFEFDFNFGHLDPETGRVAPSVTTSAVIASWGSSSSQAAGSTGRRTL